MRIIFASLLCMQVFALSAQSDSLPVFKRERVSETFLSGRIVNANTTETLRKRVMEVKIVHRFGSMHPDLPQGRQTFFGTDNASNIRLALDYGLSDRLTLSVGRNKTKQHLDAGMKFRLITQTTDATVPVSIAWYSCASLTPETDPDSAYRVFTNRLSYTHQLIVASRISPILSFVLLPTFQHRNYVKEYVNTNNQAIETNDIFSLGTGIRLKVNKTTAILADYFFIYSDYRKNNPNLAFYHPLGIGIEVVTGGHIFQLNLTNTAGIMENDFIPYTTDTWKNGGYKLGFTITRPFKM